MTIIRKASDIAEATTADLIETYNAMTGKSIKKFSSRAAGEMQVSNALLIGIDRAAHAGVPKGTEPTPKTVAEAEAKAQPQKDEEPMATKPSKKAPSKAAAATPKASKPKPPHKLVYTSVRLLTPEGVKRPQAASKRTVVLNALRARFADKRVKQVLIDDLATDCGFDVRSYIHKLVANGWCEVVSSDK